MTEEQLFAEWWKDAQWTFERNIHYSPEYPAMCARMEFISNLRKERNINALRNTYREELKNVLSPSEEFDSMAAKMIQPFSIDKAIHG